MEQGEYEKEEIDWSYVEFVDNQEVVELIEKVFYLCSYMLTCFKSLCLVLT